MSNKIMKELTKIKNHAAVQQLTKSQLENTVDWLIATANNHMNGIEPLDNETFSELGSLFDSLSSDLAYGYYDSDVDCDLFQIGNVCTEKNCAHCVNHSGFCPVDEEVK